MNLSLNGCFEARGLVPRPGAKAALKGRARDTGGTCDGYVRVVHGLSKHCSAHLLHPTQGTLVYTLQEVKPTFFMGVPRIWEKMQDTIKENVAKSSSLRKKAFAWAKMLGLKVNTKRMLG